LRFYWTLYVTALRSRAEYRVDFVLGVVTAMLSQLAALAFYWIVFSRTSSLGGWSAISTLYLIGVTAMALAVSELVFNGIWQLPLYVLGGEIDRLLVYPVRSLVFMLVSRPELHALGNLVSGAVMVTLAWQAAPPPAAAYALLPLWVVCGALIYTSALVVIGSLTLNVVGPGMHHYMIAHHLLNAARYPAHIYPAWFRYVLLFVFPIGAAVFVPARWLRGEGSLSAAVLLPIVGTGASAAIASAAWQRALRHYQSTGS
jgi:ABC-2 type transport system permease protein